LDQRRIAKRLEDPAGVAPHIVLNREHETRRQLPERRTSTGEGRRVWHKAHVGEQVIEESLSFACVAIPLLLDDGDVMGDAGEHTCHRLHSVALTVLAQVALCQDLQGVV